MQDLINDDNKKEKQSSEYIILFHIRSITLLHSFLPFS